MSDRSRSRSRGSRTKDGSTDAFTGQLRGERILNRSLSGGLNSPNRTNIFSDKERDTLNNVLSKSSNINFLSQEGPVGSIEMIEEAKQADG